MTRTFALLASPLLTGAAMLAAGAAQAKSPDIAVVSAGSEQAVRLGKTVLSRPFGALLVDHLAIVGSYKAGPATLHLVRGDAGVACPARYVVIASQPGQDPRITDPFGTCNAAARARVAGGVLTVSMPATAAGGPAVRFVYDRGAMRLIDARPAAAVAAGDAGPAGFAAPAASSCRSAANTDAATQAAVIADFQRGYPEEYRRQSTLKRIDIAPDALRGVVTGLACLATWPGAERVVPETATPLFVSKRHGKAAFAALSAIVDDPLTDANMMAAVRSFRAEMSYRAEAGARF